MSDPFDDPEDRQVRHWLAEWLAAHHDRFPVPPFETEWAAVRARLSADGLSSPAAAPRRRGRRWRWLVTVPAAIGAAVVVILLAPPPAPPDQSPPFRQSGNVVWYTSTDQLLEAPAMRYDAQPARFTYYDPIRMEVIP